jgi:hypothetical protein
LEPRTSATPEIWIVICVQASTTRSPLAAPPIIETPAVRTGCDALFDDFVGAAEKRLRYGEAERLSGLQVDGEFGVGDRLDRQLARFGTLQYLVQLSPGQAGPRRLSSSSQTRISANLLESFVSAYCSVHLFLKSHGFLGFPTGEKVDVSPIVRQMSPPRNRDSRLASHGEEGECAGSDRLRSAWRSLRP